MFIYRIQKIEQINNSIKFCGFQELTREDFLKLLDYLITGNQMDGIIDSEIEKKLRKLL